MKSGSSSPGSTVLGSFFSQWICHLTQQIQSWYKHLLLLANSRPTAGNYACYVGQGISFAMNRKVDERTNGQTICKFSQMRWTNGQTVRHSKNKILLDFLHCLNRQIELFLVLKPSIFFKDSIAIISFQIGLQIKKKIGFLSGQMDKRSDRWTFVNFNIDYQSRC